MDLQNLPREERDLTVMEIRPTIALVDDDPSVRRALRRLLSASGYDVHVFESGEALLESGVHEGAAGLVLDVHLGGMSGIELFAKLKENGSPPPPTIFITASKQETSRDRALAMGAVAWIRKPFDADVLLNALSGAIESRVRG
jgi:DNA-binding response OmpR family regulator